MGWLSNWLRKDDHPEFVLEYLEANKQINKNQPLSRLKFVCFDTETTALSAVDAQLLSIGWVTIEENEIRMADAKEFFIDTNELSKPKNVEIHGITNLKSKEVGLPFPKVLEEFIKSIHGSILIAHNAPFDVVVINESLKRNFPPFKLNNPVLDTARLAIRLDRLPIDNSPIDNKQYFLDKLLKEYNIEPLDRHTALGDAFSTALLFLKLISKLDQRGIRKLNQLI